MSLWDYIYMDPKGHTKEIEIAVSVYNVFKHIHIH